MRRFEHFAVIDWSGQAVERPAGLAVAVAGQGTTAPTLLAPAGGWSRQALLDWLLAHARAKTDMLIGLDLSPGFPFADRDAFFPGWPASPPDAGALWAMVDDMSADDQHLAASSFLAQPEVASHFRQHRRPGDLFPAGAGRLRRCEVEQRAIGLSPSSCFNLVGAAQVGKSSLTGMRVLHRLSGTMQVWPFDPVPPAGPVVVEIYTALAARAAGLPRGRSKIRDGAALDAALGSLGSDPHRPLMRYDDHATDAILTAAWLRIAATRTELWRPDGLSDAIARTEGWTFGVP